VNKTLVLAYPGTGKTFAAENFENVFDFEQQHYISIYDEDIRHLPLEQIKGAVGRRKPNPDWPQNFTRGISDVFADGRVVITTFVPSVFEAIFQTAEIVEKKLGSAGCVIPISKFITTFKGVRIILAVFDKNSFAELAERFRARGNTEEFIERRRLDFAEVHKLFEEAEGIEKVIIQSGSYLADALVQHGINLVPGTGQKNYY